jgi:uncharacterized protein YwqG
VPPQVPYSVGVPQIGEDEIREVARRHLPKKAVEELLALAEPTVALETRPGRPGLGHDSRLGGRPKVTEDFAWPVEGGRPLSLLGVLHLSSMGAVDPTGDLRGRGYLDLFFDVDRPELPVGLCPDGAFRVLHADASVFEERDTPSGAQQYPAVAFEPVVQTSVPHPDEPEVAGLLERYGNKLRKAHDDLIEAAGAPRHRMFGWPDLVSGPMRPTLPKLRAGEWRLLAQLDSDDELEWSWGNVGRLFLWVPARDLPKRRFDRCRLVLQTY